MKRGRPACQYPGDESSPFSLFQLPRPNYWPLIGIDDQQLSSDVYLNKQRCKFLFSVSSDTTDLLMDRTPCSEDLCQVDPWAWWQTYWAIGIRSFWQITSCFLGCLSRIVEFVEGTQGISLLQKVTTTSSISLRFQSYDLEGDPFQSPCGHLDVYAFPPYFLIGQVVIQVISTILTVILVNPLCPLWEWFQKLISVDGWARKTSCGMESWGAAVWMKISQSLSHYEATLSSYPVAY